MSQLFATKSMEQLRAEAAETGEHSLKRVLGPVNLITLGIGAIIGTGIFVLTGQAAAAYAGPAIVLSMVLAGVASASGGPLLRGVRVDRADRRLGLHLRLRHAGRVRRLDHRLGPDPRVRARRGHRRGGLVGLRRVSFLHDFGILIPPAYTAPFGATSWRWSPGIGRSWRRTSRRS